MVPFQGLDFLELGKSESVREVSNLATLIGLEQMGTTPTLSPSQYFTILSLLTVQK